MATENFVPGVWERLMAASDGDQNEIARPRSAIEQIKASVAQNLEDLLNTRLALPEGMLNRYPACSKSILNFGIADFAALCLTSSEDRQSICAHIKQAVDRFEPRLSKTRIEISSDPDAINKLHFIIAGKLKTFNAAQRVEFSAVLQPSTLRYSVSQGTTARG